MLRSRSRHAAVAAAALMFASGILRAFSGHAEPGQPCDRDTLKSVIGLGCGQYGSTQGQSQCGFTGADANCATRTAVYYEDQVIGTICTGTTCGECTGSYNQICLGTPVANNSECILTTSFCCFQPTTCVTTYYTDIARNPCARCDCSGPPPTAATGTRMVARVFYDACELFGECCTQ